MYGIEPRILVIDDDPRNVETLQNFLKIFGYEILTTQDGQTAIELATSEKPDLVILDVRTSDLDGYGTCQLIRESSTVPVIMLDGAGPPGCGRAPSPKLGNELAIGVRR